MGGFGIDSALGYGPRLRFNIPHSQPRLVFLRELVGQPSEHRHSSEGDQTNVEVRPQLVGRSGGNAAQKRVAVHLGEDPDEADAETDHQDRKAQVQLLVRLEGI